jgi:LEA14-like dessication related protein
MKKILFASFVLLFALIFTSGCSLLADLQRPEIMKITPSIKGIDFQGIDMMFDIDVNNPYPIRLQSPGFDYAFKIEGSRLFESESATKVDLPAKKVGTIQLPARFTYTELFKSASGLINKPAAEYELSGNFKFTPFGREIILPFSKTGNFPILKLPKITVSNVDLSDVGITGAKLKVDSVIGNPNIFGIDFEDIGYKLKLGDLDIGGLKADSAEKIKAGKEGKLSLTAEVSGISIISKLLKGVDIGNAKISPTGSIKTPYGSVKLPE